jgi:hypothetical protein
MTACTVLEHVKRLRAAHAECKVIWEYETAMKDVAFRLIFDFEDDLTTRLKSGELRPDTVVRPPFVDISFV